MRNKEIIEFFDGLALKWDEMQLPNDDRINKLLDMAGIGAGQSLLDIACGTGVLFPYYLQRGVKYIVGVELSPKMAELAKSKFPQPQITVLNEDILEHKPRLHYEQVMLYNAFPHFLQPKQLIKALADMLASGARLTIAHGMSRAAINAHHRGINAISRPLPAAEELAALLKYYFCPDIMLDNEQMYMISAIRK